MTKTLPVRRFNLACLFAPLLTPIFSSAVADAPPNSKLRYGDGKEYQTPIYDAHLRGELPVREGEPVHVFSGRTDSSCDSLGEFPAQLGIAVAHEVVTRHVCEEINPLPKIYRAAAQYIAMPMPDMDLLINGSTPPTSIKKWMKYQITLPPNHPWPIVLFSTRHFKLTGAGNESLIVLSHAEYDLLAGLTRSQPCWTTPHDYKGVGRIVEYHNGHARFCWLSQIAACDYLTTMSTLPEIHWTAEQAKSIHGLSWDTECKDSGWWEYQEKFRQDAKSWAKSHPDKSTPAIFPSPEHSPASDR